MIRVTPLFLALTLLLLVPGSGSYLAQADTTHTHSECVDDGLPLGTYAKNHDCLHEAYQALMGSNAFGGEVASRQVAELGTKEGLSESLKDGYNKVFSTLACHCSTGQCRPTQPFRVHNGHYEGLVDGVWTEIPPEALKRVDLKNVSREIIATMLMVSTAHICAVPLYGPQGPIPGKFKVECAWELTSS